VDKELALETQCNWRSAAVGIDNPSGSRAEKFSGRFVLEIWCE
jgi:hypothetical protein